MKFTTKISVLAATVAVIATSAAFADSPQLQKRIEMQRAQLDRMSQETTVGVYAGGYGVGQVNPTGMQGETRFEVRTDQHGRTWGMYVPAQPPVPLLR